MQQKTVFGSGATYSAGCEFKYECSLSSSWTRRGMTLSLFAGIIGGRGTTMESTEDL